MLARTRPIGRYSRSSRRMRSRLAATASRRGASSAGQPPALGLAGLGQAVEAPRAALGVLPLAGHEALRLELAQQRVHRVRVDRDEAAADLADVLHQPPAVGRLARAGSAARAAAAGRRGAARRRAGPGSPAPRAPAAALAASSGAASATARSVRRGDIGPSIAHRAAALRRARTGGSFAGAREGAPGPREGPQAHLDAVTATCQLVRSTSCRAADRRPSGGDRDGRTACRSRPRAARGQGAAERGARGDARGARAHARGMPGGGRRAPQLADAQLAIARELGARSWPALVRDAQARAMARGERARALVEWATSARRDDAEALLRSIPVWRARLSTPRWCWATPSASARRWPRMPGGAPPARRARLGAAALRRLLGLPRRRAHRRPRRLRPRAAARRARTRTPRWEDDEYRAHDARCTARPASRTSRA